MNEIAFNVVILPEKLGLLPNMSHEIASFIDVTYNQDQSSCSLLRFNQIKFTIFIIYKKWYKDIETSYLPQNPSVQSQKCNFGQYFN